MTKINPTNIGKVKDSTSVKGGSFVLPPSVKPTVEQKQAVQSVKKELKDKAKPKPKKKPATKKGKGKKASAGSGKTFLDMMKL